MNTCDDKDQTTVIITDTEFKLSMEEIISLHTQLNQIIKSSNAVIRTDLPTCPFCGNYPIEDTETKAYVGCNNINCPISRYFMRPERWKMRS